MIVILILCKDNQVYSKKHYTLRLYFWLITQNMYNLKVPTGLKQQEISSNININDPACKYNFF